MNLWIELERLPRSSALTIIGQLMRRHRPDYKELAASMQVHPATVHKWLRYKPRTEPEEPTPAARRMGMDILMRSFVLLCLVLTGFLKI